MLIAREARAASSFLGGLIFPMASYFWAALEIRGREPKVILAAARIGIAGDPLDTRPIGIEGAEQGSFVRLHRGTDLLQGPLLHMEGDLECGIMAPEADAAPRLIEAPAGIGKMKAHLLAFPAARARGSRATLRTAWRPVFNGAAWPPA